MLKNKNRKNSSSLNLPTRRIPEERKIFKKTVRHNGITGTNNFPIILWISCFGTLLSILFSVLLFLIYFSSKFFFKSF